MIHWQWKHPVSVLFESGGLVDFLKTLAHDRIAIITTPGFKKRGLIDQIRMEINEKLVAIVDTVETNPSIGQVSEMADQLRGFNPDCLLAVGGGSAMDSAKAVARILGESEHWSLEKHLTEGHPATSKTKLRIIAIPTTSGTGSEVTSFGTIWNHEENKKFSVTGDDLYPEIAFLDPELTSTLPKEITISCALDSISHALESTWNINANSMTFALSTQSLQLSLRNLMPLLENPSDLGFRARLMEASLFAGYAISHTRTALAHSISYPLTTKFSLPHGFACSFTLPALLDYNAKVDDGRLSSLSKSVGYESIESLKLELLSIFKKVNLKTYFEKYVSGYDQIKEIEELMITPERADHNLRGFSSRDISHLLEESFSSMV